MTTLEMHDAPKLKYGALSGLSGPRWPVVTGDVRAESGEARPRPRLRAMGVMPLALEAESAKYH